MTITHTVIWCQSYSVSGCVEFTGSNDVVGSSFLSNCRSCRDCSLRWVSVYKWQTSIFVTPSFVPRC